MDSDSQAARRGRLLGRGRRPGVGHGELPVPLDAGELADVGDAGEDVSEDGDGHRARVLREDEAAHHVDQHLLHENEMSRCTFVRGSCRDNNKQACQNDSRFADLLT